MFIKTDQRTILAGRFFFFFSFLSRYSRISLMNWTTAMMKDPNAIEPMWYLQQISGVNVFSFIFRLKLLKVGKLKGQTLFFTFLILIDFLEQIFWLISIGGLSGLVCKNSFTQNNKYTFLSKVASALLSNNCNSRNSDSSKTRCNKITKITSDEQVRQA